MPEKLTLTVSTLEDAGRRFIDAWHRAERGDGEPETILSFESWDTLVRTLTPKRLDLLRHPAASVAELVRRELAENQNQLTTLCALTSTVTDR